MCTLAGRSDPIACSQRCQRRQQLNINDEPAVIRAIGCGTQFRFFFTIFLQGGQKSCHRHVVAKCGQLIRSLRPETPGLGHYSNLALIYYYYPPACSRCGAISRPAKWTRAYHSEVIDKGETFPMKSGARCRLSGVVFYFLHPLHSYSTTATTTQNLLPISINNYRQASLCGSVGC